MFRVRDTKPAKPEILNPNQANPKQQGTFGALGL